MNDRPAQTPCLGDRVSGLADGSLGDDVRDRALAHTLTCRACRDALDVERLTLARLASLPAPQPSSRLMSALFALGETGGPLPPRRAPGPGMPRPSFVTLAPPALAVPVRPGSGSHPAGPGAAVRRTSRRSRTLVAAAGALGAGFVAAGVLGSAASGSPGPAARVPVAQLTVQPAGQQRLPARSDNVGSRFAPALLSPAIDAPMAFPAGGRSAVRPAALMLSGR